MVYKRIKYYLIYAVLIPLICFWLLGFWYFRNPILEFGKRVENVQVNVSTIRNDVYTLSEIKPNRYYKNKESVLIAEGYIIERLKGLGYSYELQEVYSHEDVFHNIVFKYDGVNSKSVVVLGAHLDSCGPDNPGADDNASGVAALLELARLFKEHKPKLDTSIEFVIYALEEPPFFATKGMGSAYHADQLKSKNLNVKFMISLEMLGYYSESMFSQGFPFSLLYAWYPWVGDFIGIVGLQADRDLLKTFKKEMSANSRVSVLSMNAPLIMQGIDFSDHRNYWEYEWPAFMITDTSFYRNLNYHTSEDTPDKLSYEKLAEVTKGIYSALINLL